MAFTQTRLFDCFRKIRVHTNTGSSSAYARIVSTQTRALRPHIQELRTCKHGLFVSIRRNSADANTGNTSAYIRIAVLQTRSIRPYPKNSIQANTAYLTVSARIAVTQIWAIRTPTHEYNTRKHVLLVHIRTSSVQENTAIRPHTHE